MTTWSLHQLFITANNRILYKSKSLIFLTSVYAVSNNAVWVSWTEDIDKALNKIKVSAQLTTGSTQFRFTRVYSYVYQHFRNIVILSIILKVFMSMFLTFSASVINLNHATDPTYRQTLFVS